MRNGPRREPYFSQPDVHSRSATAPNHMTLVFWCSCSNQTSLQKNWIESIQWLVRCAFWVVSLRKIQQKGCQNGSKSDPLQTSVSTSNINLQHIISMLMVFGLGMVFGGRKTCGWVVLRAYMGCLCQIRPKTEAEHPPRRQGLSISPQILPVA